jgi:hypothetical protein
MPDEIAELYRLEETFLTSLYEATRHGVISWEIIQNDNRTIFSAQAQDKSVQIEFVYFPTASNDTYEHILTRVTGLGLYFSVMEGTRSFDIINSMLSIQIFGWSKGRLDGIKKLKSANAKIQKLLND